MAGGEDIRCGVAVPAALQRNVFGMVTVVSRGHLLRGNPNPVCVQCGISLTILHTLRECPCYDKNCQTFYRHGQVCYMLINYRRTATNVVAVLYGIGTDRLIYLALVLVLGLFIHILILRTHQSIYSILLLYTKSNVFFRFLKCKHY
jgi:hypothetical protein